MTMHLRNCSGWPNPDPSADCIAQPIGNSTPRPACAVIPASWARLSVCALGKQCFGMRQVSKGINIHDRAGIINHHQCY